MENTIRTQIRLPDEMYQQLKASADEHGRSLNAEMLFRLNYSFLCNIDEPPNPISNDLMLQTYGQLTTAVLKSQQDNRTIKALQAEILKLTQLLNERQP